MRRGPEERLPALQTSAAVELCTGLLLLAAPSVVTKLLLGAGATGQESVVARLFGGGLVSLGVTGLVPRNTSPSRGAVIGFTVYNGATAGLLWLAGARGAAQGVLLRPVVAFHGGIALTLLPRALARNPEPEAATLLVPASPG